MAAGKYTVYVQVNGRNYKTAIKDIEVSKLKAPEISDITKNIHIHQDQIWKNQFNTAVTRRY